MAEDRIPSIAKLDSCNWPQWKLQMKNYLGARSLWKLCIMTQIEPVQEKGETIEDLNVRKELYFANNCRVMTILGQTVSEKYLHLILNSAIDTPKKAWDALAKNFERATTANKMELQRQLFRFQMKPGVTIEAHLKEFSELIERCVALNIDIEEIQQCCAILCSLPDDKYSYFTNIWFDKDEKDIKFTDLTESLLAFEHRRLGVSEDGTKEFSTSKDAVLNASRSTVSSRRALGPCYGCSLMGHLHRNCPTNPPSSNFVRGSFRNNRWNNDVRTNSTTRSVNFSGNARGAYGKQNYKHSHVKVIKDFDTDKGGLFTLLSDARPVDKDKWIIDSGATSHIVNDQTLLINYKVFERKQRVVTADGKICSALGVGDVKLRCYTGTAKAVNCDLLNVLFVPEVKSNFFSVCAATKRGNIVKFGSRKVSITNHNQRLVATGSLIDDLYILNVESTEHHACGYSVKKTMQTYGINVLDIVVRKDYTK